jgi:hypothetical protein
MDQFLTRIIQYWNGSIQILFGSRNERCHVTRKCEYNYIGSIKKYVSFMGTCKEWTNEDNLQLYNREEITSSLFHYLLVPKYIRFSCQIERSVPRKFYQETTFLHGSYLI